MAKSKHVARESQDSLARVADQAEAVVAARRSGDVWIRDDGAVCVGDECLVIHPTGGQGLDVEVDPSRCGQEAGRKLLDHLINTAGQPVNWKVKPATPKTELSGHGKP